MNCFYHPTTVAVGVCKSCGKGLCPSCAVDLDKGLACRNRCEEEATAVIALVDESIKRAAATRQIYDSAKSNRFTGAAFYLLFGALCIGFCIYSYATDNWNPGNLILAGMGILFLGFGSIALIKAIQYSRASR